MFRGYMEKTTYVIDYMYSFIHCTFILPSIYENSQLFFVKKSVQKVF